MPESLKICSLCKHSLENNSHGFDQNDAYINDKDELVHSGSCTYCLECNPRLRHQPKCLKRIDPDAYCSCNCTKEDKHGND